MDGLDRVIERRVDYADNGRLSRIENKLDKISDVINGNGNPGLRTLIDRHDQQLTVVRWASGTTLVGFIIALITKLVGKW